VIREATLDDAAAVARLSALVYPAELVTARGLRHAWKAVPQRAQRRMWTAEEAGELVGFASAGRSVGSGDPGACVASVHVHPELRRRGLGAALWECVEARLAELDALHVNAFGLDEEPSRRFMGARGFEVTFVQRMARLDPRMLPPPPEPPPGVRLLPFSRLDDPRAVYELEVETIADVPVDQPLDDVRWEEWHERWWLHPELDREASLIALVDGEPAAFTMLISDLESGRAETGMTGTARRFRGRGLALLVKRHSLSLAAARGITVAITQNDERNAPMLRINERLGYRPAAANATFTRRA
jgi:GNAT superfamily N-acetyltransferase